MVSAKGQYSRYRQTLQQTTGPIVPFLGVYLTDLTFIELGNPDYIPESNFINFEKRRKVAVVVNEIYQYQQNTFHLQEIPALRDFIHNLGKNGWPEEKALYERSWIVEPREESVDDE